MFCAEGGPEVVGGTLNGLAVVVDSLEEAGTGRSFALNNKVLAVPRSAVATRAVVAVSPVEVPDRPENIGAV